MVNSITEEIKIVKYNDELAKSVAEMWNESRDSWGGDSAIMTEEQVKEREANSEDLFLFLALKDDKVVGYCGISEYKEDINALYIRLLNVHPKYHGQKIGKKLVLKAVEKTVELGWPRIDLYTWPGNVKAVPLYKKCGFFWEDRDNTTHLMNFIPMLLQNEITKPFFQQIDWYKDNKRLIEVKPDGIMENGFTYFEYLWENENHILRVQVEKSGRGIRLIETKDFLIEASMDHHTQIEGLEQKCKLRIKNKGVNSIPLNIEGLENERIQLIGKKERSIHEEEIIEIPVVIRSGEEPNEWITHPRAEIKVHVYDQAAIFALGVNPKKAMKIAPVYQANKYEFNEERFCFLEIENHLEKGAELVVELSDNPYVEWQQGIVSSSIEKTGMIKLPFKVKKYGFLQSVCKVTVKYGNQAFSWEEIIAFPIPNFGVKDGGFDKEYFYLQNGFYKVVVRKRDNTITFGSEQQLFQRTVLFPPKFGKPYVGELSKKQATRYEWKHDNLSAKMKIYYAIDKPYSMNFAICFELFGEGFLNVWLELNNTSGKSIEKMYVYQPIRHELNQTYMPLNDQIVYFNDSKFTDLEQLNSKNMSENWIFSDDKRDPHGISWDEHVKIGFDGWQFYLEEIIEKLGVNEKIKTKPIQFSLGAIKKVEDFQLFATKNSRDSKVVKELELRTESRNPITLKNEVNLVLQRSQNRYFEGELTFKSTSIADKTVHVKQEDNQEIIFTHEIEKKPFVPIHYTLESESQKISSSFLLLHQNNERINKKQLNEGDHEIYEITNGNLFFRAAPSFFPTLYSLKYNGQEWLDSSFPEAKPKAWWNPWAGGMRSYLNGISLFSFLKEENKTRFVEKMDQYQNKWEGIAIETNVENHDKWKGLKMVQYFLTLPGIPIVTHFTELLHANRMMNEYFYTELWLKNSSLKDTQLHLQEVSGSKSFRAGSEEHIFKATNPCYFANNQESQCLQLFNTKEEFESECIFSEEFALKSMIDYLSIEPEQKYYTTPVFLLFPEHPFKKETIDCLKMIKF
ncbi:GNAT family N-acetyltransferase [Heyndrickxia sporothermodurans]